MLEFKNNKIINCGTGISLNTSRQQTAIISGNEIHRCDTGINLSSTADSSVSVEDNSISECRQGIIAKTIDNERKKFLTCEDALTSEYLQIKKLPMIQNYFKNR